MVDFVDDHGFGLSQAEVAVQLGITRCRVSQLELQALAKMHVLWMADELDHGRLDDSELRLLIAHARNAQRKKPRPPIEVNARWSRARNMKLGT